MCYTIYFLLNCVCQTVQYEAAWRAGNWDFSLLNGVATPVLDQKIKCGHFNENLHR